MSHRETGEVFITPPSPEVKKLINRKKPVVKYYCTTKEKFAEGNDPTVLCKNCNFYCDRKELKFFLRNNCRGANMYPGKHTYDPLVKVELTYKPIPDSMKLKRDIWEFDD